MKEIKTWDDYCKVNGDSMYFETNELMETSIIWENNDVPLWMRKKWVAEYKINKLMPYYGGAITDAEWEDIDIEKYIIGRRLNKMYVSSTLMYDKFLAFRTRKQRDSFLENNKELVNEFLMIG